MTVRPYVEIPRPYQTGPHRFHVELHFPASARRRAEQHQSIARELARIYDVEANTPYKLNPRWSIYEETWGNRERFGHPDYRRLNVSGTPRVLARYLAALPRVLTATERLATRAARAFGTWRRSLVAVLSGHLEYEDPATLRIRAKDFRAEVLDTLVGYLALGAPRTLHRDPARPLWEQADAVASEVWHDSPVDPWSVPEADIQAQLERMQHTELSIVDGPETEQPTVMVPDTVDELLELSGPAQKAPVEHVPKLVRTTHTLDVTGHGEQMATPGTRPAPTCRTGGGALPVRSRRERRRRRARAEVRGTVPTRPSATAGLSVFALSRTVLSSQRSHGRNPEGVIDPGVPRPQEECVVI